jgi:cytochrome c oxidase cbb3-type subunit III
MNQTDAPKSALEHDGILEIDRPIPGWWKWVFVSTITFAPFYALYFHAGTPGRSIADQHQQNVSENLRRQYAEIGDLDGDQATMIRMMKEPKWIKLRLLPWVRRRGIGWSQSVRRPLQAY